MTSYWDDWGVILSKIERGEKVDNRKLFNALCELINSLHNFEHEHHKKPYYGHIIDVYLRKNKKLEELIKSLKEPLPERK